MDVSLRKVLWNLSLSFGLSAGLLLSSVESRAESPQLLKVLSLNFNSELLLLDTDYRVRDFRFAAIVEWVLKNDPDVVLIQEGWNYRDDASIGVSLAAALGYDLTYRLDMGAPFLLYDSDVILAKKNLHMKSLKSVKLPHSAVELGDGKTWIISLGAISYVVGARLTLPGGEPIYVYSTHLVGADDQERADQAKALGNSIRKQLRKDGLTYDTAKVIVGGDFNSHPDSTGIQFLRNQGFEDTWAAAHPGDESCTNCSDPTQNYFNPFTIGANQFPDQSDQDIDERIDYIFTRGPGLRAVASTLTFNQPTDGIWMSDHYGVFTTLALNGFAAENNPNPLRDAPDSDPAASVWNVGDAIFACDPDAASKPCRQPLPDISVRNGRGLAVQNGSSQGIEFHIKGKGIISTSPDADLDPKTQGAFTFSADGDYQYTIENDDGIKRHGTVHVKVTN